MVVVNPRPSTPQTAEVSEQSLDFDGLQIAYDHRILVPRAWTVRQSRWAEELLADAPAGDVLELCSGAGHIGLRAVADTDRRLVMVDVDPVACSYARRNAAAAAMADRVEVREAALATAVRTDERFALVIADPPWVLSDVTQTFPDDPLLAIDGGADGLGVARACVEVAAAHLLDGAALLIQLGSAEQAKTLCAGTSFELRGLLTEAGRGVVAHLVRADR